MLDFNDQPAKTPPTRGKRDTGHVDAEIVGAVIDWEAERGKALATAKETNARLKAVRRTRAYFGDLDIGTQELEALSIVATWCELNGRDAGPINEIVYWSGYTSKWKYRVKQGIHLNVDLGLLEWIQVPNGRRVGITEKGHRVLVVYSRMIDVVYGEFAESKAKAQAKKAEREAKKAMKHQRQAA